MSSYAELKVGGFYLGTTRNELDPQIMTLFREDDRRMRLIPADSNDNGADSSDLDQADLELVQYAVPVAHAIDQLEIMGFPHEVAAGGFSRGLADTVESTEKWNRRQPELFKGRLELLKSLTPVSWLEGIKQNRQLGLRPTQGKALKCCGLPPI